MSTAIVWFRQDLRLSDNPALYYAAKENHSILPLYILDESLGKAQQWWLHQSLFSLQKQFKKYGVPLLLKRGNALAILKELCEKKEISAIYWNRCYEPAAIKRDREVKEKLTAQGIKVQSYKGNLLHEPWEVKNKQGSFFKVFTPFWNKLALEPMPMDLLPVPILKAAFSCETDVLDQWKLQPKKPNWAMGLEEAWKPGERQAQKMLDHFISELLCHYSKDRDFPAKNGSSRLSPYLHFGEISARQIAAAINQAKKSEPFLRQLYWREFSYHLLYHFSKFPEENFQEKFNRFEWKYDPELLMCWQKGQTGYPIVDAGMRELWHTGYMHNRVRMIAASFLVKDLLIDWREGAKWFWDTLVDADLANNSMGWQWVAGSGVDASPYYRIFNPILQGKKFDPEGEYVRRWIPELARTPKAHIHEPWKSPENIRKNYPAPIIEHNFARQRALETYKKLKSIPMGRGSKN